MSVLFDETEINGMKLANRFVRSATWEGMATEDGVCTPELTQLMESLAGGQVGLIITSHAYVRKDGQAGPRQLGINRDDQIENLAAMVRSVQKLGGRIAVQISHAGYFAHPNLTGQTPVAASPVENFVKTPRIEMTEMDGEEIVEAFGLAARRALEAGFDAVQIHCAHGYLLSQFLSPAFNKRRDKYGGTLENRSRMLLDVLSRVRKEVGPGYPVLVKMNSEDFLEGGLTTAESLRVGGFLKDGGIDAIELSGGTLVSGKLVPTRAGINSEEKEAYFKETSKRFKSTLGIPLMLVGGNRSFQVAEGLLKEGYADYISMSRPFIREPDLVKRWQTGDLRKSSCLSDNQCFGPAMAGEGIYCVVEKRKGAL